VLYIVHFTAFCLGGPFFFRSRCIWRQSLRREPGPNTIQHCYTEKNHNNIDNNYLTLLFRFVSFGRSEQSTHHINIASLQQTVNHKLLIKLITRRGTAWRRHCYTNTVIPL